VLGAFGPVAPPHAPGLVATGQVRSGTSWWHRRGKPGAKPPTHP